MFAASKTDSASTGGYEISRSLRFNDADSAYLNRTFPSAGNRKTWTWSGWVKRTGPTNPTNAVIPFFGVTNAGNDSGFFVLGALGDVISLQLWNTTFRRTTAVYRDYSAWYHIVVAFDTTQATAANRIKLYVNNVEPTSFSISVDPTLNADYPINSNVAHNIFSEAGVGGAELGGYLTEVNFIDGQYLTPSSFGEINAQTGVWQPKAFSGGAYGTNGFYLNFSDNSNTTAATLGKDYSGNGNNWTPNGFSVSAGAGNDSLVDVPTPYGVDTGAGGTVRGNYATFNPLQGTGITGAFYTANGNLDLNVLDNSGYRNVSSTFSPEGFKGYCEITIATAPNFQIGFSYETLLPTNTLYTSTGTFYIVDSGVVKDGPNVIKSGCTPAFSSSDILQIAFDFTGGARNVWFGRNGTWGSNTVGVGDPANGTNPVLTVLNIAQAVRFYFGINTGAGTVTINANFGQRPFAYTAPSGFKALCTQNLPTPTVGATTATQAGKFFNPVLYTGNDTARNITGVGFQPDWVWTKFRSAVSNHRLFDVLRGVEKPIYSSATTAEGTETGTLTAFISDGFSLGTNAETNLNGYTFVAWNWKANGAGSTNTAGSITSTVSANTTSGFSVVTYTGTGSNATVGHGLGVAPSMIIGKARNSALAWRVYHTSIGAANFLALNTTDASASGATWNSTTPTSTVFTVGGGSNMNVDSSTTYVAYCFAPIAGYSAFGSYTGNGSADGPFVYTGFRPAYVMLKRTDGTGDWWIYDTARSTYNAADKVLFADTSAAEITDANIDLLSNGFKFRTATYQPNTSGGTFIYMAFAESPFKYSLAR